MCEVGIHNSKTKIGTNAWNGDIKPLEDFVSINTENAHPLLDVKVEAIGRLIAQLLLTSGQC